MVELCRNLSYERSLSPGKAVFFYKTEGSDFEPLEVESHHLRGSKCAFAEAYEASGRLRNKDSLSKLAFGNPIYIESCFVPPNVEYLYCRFSLLIKANAMQPLVCSSLELTEHLKALAKKYRDADGFEELARRYCVHLLDGSWLWRNQYVREMEVSLNIADHDGELLVSNLHRCSKDPLQWDQHSREVLDKITSGISRALHDPQVFWFAEITPDSVKPAPTLPLSPPASIF